MSEAQFEDLLYGVKDGVATITINRPDRMNAMRGLTFFELAGAIEMAGQDKSVGVIVLTSTGERAFSAGGDVKWEKDGGLADRHMTFNPRNVHEAVRHSGKPEISVVKGYAIGMGNHLAYYCDLTIAADNAIFGQNGPRVGSPASGHIVQHLAHVVGHKRAREMWMMCRQYTAAEMMDWGLINAVVPYAELDAEVARWCQELLALSPSCLRVIKQTFRDDLDPFIDSTVNDVVARVIPKYFETGEQQEGANAFLEKRAPDFSPWR